MKIMTDMIPKWQRVTGWVLSGILALVFLPSAFFKIAQPKGCIQGDCTISHVPNSTCSR